MSVKASATRMEDSRARILDAAHRLFGEQGTGEVTMADVAEAAGVSRATVFNQFGSKHALVEAVTESVYAGYQAILDNAVADRQTPVPVLVRALFEIMGHGIELDRRFYRAVFRELARVTLGLDEGSVAQQARQRAVERLVHLLTRGQARGELVASFDAADLAVAFDSLVFGVITHWLYDDPSEPLNERMLRAADIFLGPVATIDARAYEGPRPDLAPPPLPTRSPTRREP
jgi:AcrR family transcriptional regulator